MDDHKPNGRSSNPIRRIGPSPRSLESLPAPSTPHRLTFCDRPRLGQISPGSTSTTRRSGQLIVTSPSFLQRWHSSHLRCPFGKETVVRYPAPALWTTPPETETRSGLVRSETSNLICWATSPPRQTQAQTQTKTQTAVGRGTRKIQGPRMCMQERETTDHTLPASVTTEHRASPENTLLLIGSTKTRRQRRDFTYIVQSFHRCRLPVPAAGACFDRPLPNIQLQQRQSQPQTNTTPLITARRLKERRRQSPRIQSCICQQPGTSRYTGRRT